LTAAPIDLASITLEDIQAAHVLDIDTHVERYRDDPLRFVLHWFTWEPGEGPDEWQVEFLTDLGKILQSRKFDGKTPVDPIRMAVASGHGIGKGAMIAWLHWWIMITRKNAKGTVTANTDKQIRTKTWAEIQKWYLRLRCRRDRFDVEAESCKEKDHRATWFSTIASCAPENSEAYHGQHNRESTSFYLFDEASNIPDSIFEVAQAGLTDGEPMIFCFANATRNTGELYEIGWGKQMHRWNFRSIDARTCKFPNKEEQAKLIEDHGIDSDVVRVRILGEAPAQSELQLISRSVVEEAQRRPMAAMPGDPLIAGVDVPNGGNAWFVVRFRRGLDSRPGTLIPAPVRVAGSKIDRETMVAKLAQILSERDSRKRVDMMFVDMAYGAPLVARLQSLNHQNVMEIDFGGASIDPGYANMRAWMWGKMMKDWLTHGAIDPEDKKLAMDLIAPGFHHKREGDGPLVLESKDSMQKRNIAPVDDGDALCLTFARPVAPAVQMPYSPPPTAGNPYSWMA
jgi:hypothetical protein